MFLFWTFSVSTQCPYLVIFRARIVIIAVTCVSLKLFERFSAVRCSFARTWGCGLVKSQNKSVRCFYVRALLFLLLLESAVLCSVRFTCLINFGIFGTILKLRDFDMNCESLGKKCWLRGFREELDMFCSFPVNLRRKH